jgi:hypothetical protein
MASNTDPANLIIDTEHDCQRSTTNATRYRLDPANDTGKPHDPTRSPIHRHYIQRYTLHAHGYSMAHDTHGRHDRQAGGR